MFKILKSIFSLILVVMVVVTTGGFRIFSHQCNCCHSYEFSLTGINTCCEIEEKNNTCDIEDHESLCCSEKIHVEIKKQCKTDQCCQVISRFYRLDNLFNKTEDIQINKVQFFDETKQIIHTETHQNEFVKKLIYIAENSPPKIPYKNFIVFAHTLKIPF